LSRLTAAEAKQLNRWRTCDGRNDSEACKAIVDILTRGVKSAHIINGNSRNSLLAEVFTDEGTAR
jgi:acetylglutamate kinase